MNFDACFEPVAQITLLAGALAIRAIVLGHIDAAEMRQSAAQFQRSMPSAKGKLSTPNIVDSVTNPATYPPL